MKKGAIKTDFGWKSLSEAADEEGPVRLNFSFMLRNYKTPAAQAEEWPRGRKQLKQADGVIVAT